MTGVRRWRRWASMVGAVALGAAGAAQAAGTPAGTLIPNTATLEYIVQGRVTTTTAAAPVLTVAEVLNVLLTWQDGALVPVRAGEGAKPLTFVLTNTGNGTETFDLSRSNALAGDAFHPVSPAAGALYLESGAEPGLQTSGPHADVLYRAGVNDPTLAADASTILYAPSDIPAALPQGAVGRLTLEARAATPGAAGAAPGTALTGGRDPGMVAVVGSGRAQAAATGGYVVSGLSLSLAKSVVARRDPNGGELLVPGSRLTYRIVLTLEGTGTAQNLIVTDPLPAGLSYVPDSLSVDGVARTDAADGDHAGFADGVVRAEFGDVAAPATRTVEFKTTLN